MINQAFERLTGGTNADPPQPVSAVVLILRALWEYLHIHGLGRLLAKPLKMLLALRNILLVSLWYMGLSFLRLIGASRLSATERSPLSMRCCSRQQYTLPIFCRHFAYPHPAKQAVLAPLSCRSAVFLCGCGSLSAVSWTSGKRVCCINMLVAPCLWTAM